MALTLRDLVPEQEPEVLGADFQFTEGPVWHPDGYLLFSDIPANTIYRYTPGRKAEPYITPSRNSNGLTFDGSGRLLACEHGGRQVSRMDSNGQMVTLVSRSNGKRLNSPNDIVVHSRGSVFFTDPPYGIDPDPGERGSTECTAMTRTTAPSLCCEPIWTGPTAWLSLSTSLFST
jgi:gluconolactonase